MKTEVKRKVINDSRQCLKTIRRWKYQKERKIFLEYSGNMREINIMERTKQ